MLITGVDRAIQTERVVSGSARELVACQSETDQVVRHAASATKGRP
jgi:hypothetical protein